MEKCSNCGSNARVVRGDYVFRESGLPVTLREIEMIRCDSCGNVDPIIPKLSQLMRRLALAVVQKPNRLRGEEVRFLRKYLELSAERFAKLISVHPSTLSKWENNEDPVGEQSDRLIRLVALALGKGLAAETQEMEKTVLRFPSIRKPAPRKRITMNVRTLEYKYA